MMSYGDALLLSCNAYDSTVRTSEVREYHLGELRSVLVLLYYAKGAIITLRAWHLLKKKLLQPTIFH